MQKVILEKNDVLEYVETTLNDIISTPIVVFDDMFHHNTRYEDTISIIENGILTGKDQNKMGILSDEKLELFEDIESHANGSESISLAVVGMTDLYPDEFEYDPFCEKSVDILITGDVSARRVSTNYGNEYITDECIKHFDTNYKMNPPLCTESDRLAVIEGVIDGTLTGVVKR